MEVLQAAVLGLIQGITEFLPISSSGHLILVPGLFGWQDQGIEFDAIIHLATFLAVIIYFRSDILNMIRGIIGNKKFAEYRRLAFLIILATIPAALVGIFLGDYIEQSLRSVQVVAAGLIFWGVILFIADKWSQSHAFHKTEAGKINLKEALVVGIAQAIALIPGTSRSGITMTAGMFQGFSRQTAARFSFLLGIPAIFGAGLIKGVDVVQNGIEMGWAALAVGFLTAFLSGLAAIWFLMKLLAKHGFSGYVVYRILLGTALLLLFFGH